MGAICCIIVKKANCYPYFFYENVHRKIKIQMGTQVALASIKKSPQKRKILWDVPICWVSELCTHKPLTLVSHSVQIIKKIFDGKPTQK